MKLVRVLAPIGIAVVLLAASLVGLALAYAYEVSTWAVYGSDAVENSSCTQYDGPLCTGWYIEAGLSPYDHSHQQFNVPVTSTVYTFTGEFGNGNGDFHIIVGGCGSVNLGPIPWPGYSAFTKTVTCGGPLAAGDRDVEWGPQGGAWGTVRNIHIYYESEIPPVGGWPACSTVDNADFDTSSNWTLQGTAAITGSILDLPATGDGAYQDFQIVSNLYTVTIVMERVSSGGTDGLVVAIAPPTGSTGHVAASDPIAIPNDGTYHTEVVTIRPDTLGDGTLHIVSNGSHKVDYICLEAGYGENKCTSSSQSFDFETGYNVDSSFTSWGWGYSQHWRGVDYPFPGWSGGRAVWQCGTATGCGFTTGSMFAAQEQATIRYDYMVVPQAVTVTASSGAFASVEILTSPDGESWTIAQSKANPSGVVTFTLDYEAPVYVMVASLNDTGINLMNLTSIEAVELTGCYAGPNTFAGCIVGDPDFDVSDGYPSRFYWDGNYEAVPGAASLHPDGFIAQAFTPPWVGQYDLAIVGSSTDPACLWRAMFTNYGSGVTVASTDVPCTRGSNATYNLPFGLPADPLMVWIEQRAGTSSISRVCLTPATGVSQCLNPNPSFDNGSVGYVAQPGFLSDSGDARLPENYSLAAVDVRYNAMPPPYSLQVVVSPRTVDYTGTLTINNGSMPGFDASDTDYSITQTTSLTYDIQTAYPGNTGPMLWNFKPDDGDFLVSWYCITRSVALTQYLPPTDPYTCTTVTNPSFTAGLDNWTANGNVLAVNGVASFAIGGQLSQQLASFDVTSSTVRWLTRAYAPTAITLTVASDYGTYDYGHSLVSGGGGFFQETVPISGATAITVTSGSSGLELDFICLYPGNTAPPLITGTISGTVTVPPNGLLAQCVAPPMGILPNNLTSTIASLWPWGGSITYYELLMIYNTAWVRYIGCKFDEYVAWMKDDMWGLSLFQEVARGRCIVSVTGVTSCGLRGMLDIIIGLLAFSALLNAINALVNTLNLIEGTLKDLIEGALDAARTVAYLLGLLGLVIAAIVGLLVLIAALIWLIWQIPAEFWTSFRTAAISTTTVPLPLPSSSEDPLYNIIIGLQLINQVAGATFLYPVVVVAIVVGSIGILLWTIRQFTVKI